MKKLSHLGRTSFSLSVSVPFSLNVLNLDFGGYLNGCLPKLKMHC